MTLPITNRQATGTWSRARARSNARLARSSRRLACSEQTLLVLFTRRWDESGFPAVFPQVDLFPLGKNSLGAEQVQLFPRDVPGRGAVRAENPLPGQVVTVLGQHPADQPGRRRFG